ncbi:branched-chain amino acid aminotransferase/4-amino-4-deoxychorismate lyase [Cenarchaeum symbiosum A]|uniref:Branched-chain-amino-acid aminotransferase n=1 Tax=Cenarchaeum symbiosum (strain A) TaxID=414004 RepID=A0RXD1_CENSY|nr:branched-chain amino acid aminotransferase/4-amino-4-deoxychorismate lyase [Cenarchaeum symbiosum A]
MEGAGAAAVKSEKIWMNGSLVPYADARVHVLTHALHYSTAVFEGLRCYETPKGPAIFRLDEHIERLFNSAKIYSMKVPYSPEEIKAAISETIKANKFTECYIRPLIYYGLGGMGLTVPEHGTEASVSCWEWKTGESAAGKTTGARCKVSSWTRIDGRAQPVKAKAASNYANAVLARMEAHRDGYDEAIMLNGAGKVAEASAANIFVKRRGAIITPPLSSGVLEGITRDSIMRIIRDDGGEVLEHDLDREDLYTADEIFMVGTAAEVKSVTELDGVNISSGSLGATTKRLQELYTKAVTGADERYLGWLTYL